MPLFSLAASALLAGLAAAAPAAQDRGAQDTGLTVHYGDLDLASEAGIAALDRRLDSAIRSHCRQITPYLPHQAQIRHECLEEARQAAEAQRSAAIASARGGAMQISARED